MLDHGGIDRIMLDNFSVDDTRKAVKMINGNMRRNQVEVLLLIR